VHENAKEELLGPGVFRAGPKRGSELALVLGEGSFHMNATVVDVLGESALQLATVLGRGPLASAARIDGNHRGADSHIPTELVMSFAVVGLVGEDAIPVDAQRTIQKGRTELGSVVAGSLAHLGRQPQVGQRVAQDGEFGIGGSEKRLRVWPLVPEMNTDVAGFVSGGVQGSLGLGIDQAAAVGSITDRIEESIEAPFFKRRA